ncbi:hypothetical protein Tco_1168580 [Tanacetum coccineum]
MKWRLSWVLRCGVWIDNMEVASHNKTIAFMSFKGHVAWVKGLTIYASYIEQFWNTVNSQTVNDVKQIYATVDDKTVVILESSVRSDLHFNDEDGITCLTNTAIFENLALMGYESDSDKLTFKKAFFSPKWKYLIHTILHCLSSKSTSWNEVSTNIASAVICIATGQNFNFSKLIFDEPFNDTYEIPKHTKKVLTNMKRKGKDFSGRVTPLFASMLAPPVVGGDGSGQPSEPQPPSSTTEPIIEEQIPVTELSSPQNTQSPRQTLQKDTQLPQNSVPIPNVANEAVFKERDDRVVRDTTTAASLDATHASGDRPRCQEAIGGALAHIRSERASKHSYDSPLPRVNTPGSDEERNEQHDLTDFVPPTPYDLSLSGGHTPRSDEGRPNLNELMAICTNLSNRVLALEQSKTAQDLVINKLQKKVKRLEKVLKARTLGVKLFKIGTSRRKGLDMENVSKQGRKSNKTKPMFKDSDFDVLDDAMKNVEGGSIAEQINTTGDTLNTASINVSVAGPSTSAIGDIFEDEMTTIADTLVAIRSARPRTTSVVIRNVKEELRRATPVPTVQSQDKGKGKMVEPEPQFEREQRIARERAAEQEAKDASLIKQMEDVQARMDANELLAVRLQEQEREQFSVDEQARFLVETIAARKKFFAAQRAAEIRNRPPTRTQLRNQMITYLKHIGKYTHNQLKSKSFEEIQKLYKKEQQWINDFVPMSDDSGKKDDSSSKQAESSKKRPRAEHDEESVKKQKL